MLQRPCLKRGGAGTRAARRPRIASQHAAPYPNLPIAQALADAKAVAREAGAQKAAAAAAAKAEAEAKRARENQARAPKGSTNPISITG